MLQSVTNEKIVAFAAQRRVKNLGMRVIVAHFNACQSEHPDARVFQLIANQIRELALDLVSNAQGAGIIFRHNAFTRAALPALQATRDFDDFVCFQLIPKLDIVEVFKRKSTLETRSHLSHVVLEALEGIEFTRMD
jgi:hypothetical protein